MNTFHIRRAWAFLIIGVMLLIAVAAGAYFYYQKNKDATIDKNNNQCNNDDIGAEVKAKYVNFDASMATGMSGLIDKITQLPDHEKSVNCLYIVGRYYSVTNNSQATAYFDGLLQLHQSNNTWIDSALGSEQPSDIEALNNFLKSPPGDMYKNRVREGMIPALEESVQ